MPSSSLLNATRHMAQTDRPPTVLSDGGVENVNAQVEALIDSGSLRRVLALTEIAFSNSMIESWWRTLKHQWLYLNTLDTVSSLHRLVAFYVEEHNTRLPHSAFHGETPDEMYFGTGRHVADELRSQRTAARLARLQSNRAVSCVNCERTREAS